MSEEQKDGRSAFDAALVKIAGALTGENIADAEKIVEAARRIVWMRHFAGAAPSAVAAMLHAPSGARFAAQEVVAASGGSLLVAEEVFLELRMCLYISTYGNVPGTRFVEEAKRYGGPPAGHRH